MGYLAAKQTDDGPSRCYKLTDARFLIAHRHGSRLSKLDQMERLARGLCWDQAQAMELPERDRSPTQPSPTGRYEKGVSGMVP